jgi:hypothetical protein
MPIARVEYLSSQYQPPVLPRKMGTTYAKANHPLPRVWKPGGVANIDTRRINHQSTVMIRSRIETQRSARTVKREYGDTAGSPGSRRRRGGVRSAVRSSASGSTLRRGGDGARLMCCSSSLPVLSVLWDGLAPQNLPMVFE